MTRMKRLNLIMVFVGLLLFLGTSLASAEVMAKSDELKSFVALYAWLPAVYGDVRVKGVNFDVNADFGDILNNIDFFWSGHYEGFRGHWGIMADVLYATLNVEKSYGPGSGKQKLNFTQSLIEVDVPYRLTWNPVVFDIFAGGRYNYIDNEIDIASVGLNKHGSLTFTDLIVGGRVLFPLGKDWSMGLRGDVGGFGIGNATDLSVNGVLSVNWQINELVSIHAGYRVLYMRYDNNDDKWDTTQHGPFIALGFSF
jgi:hypothetical protein